MRVTPYVAEHAEQASVISDRTLTPSSRPVLVPLPLRCPAIVIPRPSSHKFAHTDHLPPFLSCLPIISDLSNSMADPAADARARRLAAIEARLNPPKEDDGAAAAAGSSGSNTPGREPPRNMPKPWTRPSEREQNEKKRELTRLLNRTIVRDSGYRQAAECVEVSAESSPVFYSELPRDGGG